MSRLEGFKALLDLLEPERDKMLDNYHYVRGSKDMIEKIVKGVSALYENEIKNIEIERLATIKREEALKVAREKGNVGVHPSERPNTLQERREQAPSVSQSETTPPPPTPPPPPVASRKRATQKE